MIEIFDYVFCAKVIMPNVYRRQNNGPRDDLDNNMLLFWNL